MADGNNIPDSSDILGQLLNAQNNNEAKSAEQSGSVQRQLFELTKSVKSVDTKLSDILRVVNGSQTSGRNYGGESSSSWRSVGNSNTRSSSKSKGDFLDGIDDAISEAFSFDEIKNEMNARKKRIASAFGTEVEDLEYTIAHDLTADIASSFKNSGIANSISKSLKASSQKYFDKMEDELIKLSKQLKAKSLGQDISDTFSSNTGSSASSEIASKLSEKLSNSKFGQTLKGTKVGKAAESAVGAAGKAATKLAGSTVGTAAKAAGSAALGAAGGPVGLALIAGTAVVDKITDLVGKSLSDVAEKVDDLFGSIENSSARSMTSAQKRTELGNERLRKDIETIVKEPFEVLEAAAQKVYDAWDSNLSYINQTQGYSKAELQDLVSNYASRLRDEGLESVVSSSDMMTNMKQVLSSGLSGQVAEEFAYQATKFNAAVPTQDFFNYASTYASLAANAIKQGKSQSEAIEYANEQLELFASDVLYASRELAGGFSTGLQDASDLFSKSVQIATASKTGNPSQIAGVLTSVSAITGAIAPDLANSMVDAIYNAAVGGNSSQLVALRSLAGINASNTDFLRKFSNNPQGVFATLFSNLANMQNMSSSNYMEVAEGLSSVFGLDSAAFSRIDFNYLADAVKNMKVSDSAITENLNQLASGESTLSAEQMKIKQINEYMIGEGLSYVLDNEAARAVQQHMWDEQIAQEMQENTYAVDLRGDALSALTSISNLVTNILGILVPTLGSSRLGSLVQTISEATQLDDRVKSVLEAGKVGQGNAKVLSNLTTTGKDLKLTNSYLELLADTHKASGSTGYTWGVVGKSTYSSYGSTPQGSIVSTVLSSVSNTVSATQAKLQANFERMKDSMSKFFGSTFESTINDAIAAEAKSIAANTYISDASIAKLAKEYLADPSKYGLEDVLYDSKLANASKASGLSSFNQEAQNRAYEIAKQRAESDLRLQAESNAKDLATKRVMNQAASGKYGGSGYDAWAATASKYGISDLSSALTELGYTESDVKDYFTSMETQKGAQDELERQNKEFEFWENTQSYLDLLNVNMHDVFDKGDVMGILWPGIDSWLADIDSSGNTYGTGFRGEVNSQFDLLNSNLNQWLHTEIYEGMLVPFRKDWTDYYINHTTYNEHLGQAYSESLSAIKKAEAQSNEDQLNALTEALTNNDIKDLMDPTVQNNVILAQILRVVQGIFQQNNTQGKLKLPDAIAALATGMTVSDNS